MKTNKTKIQAKELEERIYSLSSSLSRLRNNFVHEYKPVKFEISHEAILKSIESFSEYDKINWITPASLSSFYRPFPFYSIRRRYKAKPSKRLENLSIEELTSKLSEYSSDQQKILKIQSLIAKKSFALWLEKKIRKLKKVLKILLEGCARLENKREFFRKINCFYFKNLDDTHSTIAFN